VRTIPLLLLAVCVAAAEDENPQAYLAAVLETCPRVTQANVKGNLNHVSLDKKTHHVARFEGETGNFELTRLDVTAGAPKGARLWSRNLRRAYSEDGKTWVDGTTGSTAEAWGSWFAPEDLVYLLKTCVGGVQFGGCSSVGKARCRIVQVSLSQDGVQQLLARAGVEAGEIDQATLMTLLTVRVGEEDGLLYGIDASLSASGTLPPGAQDVKPPEDPDAGPLGIGNPEEMPEGVAYRSSVTWQVSYEFSGHTDKKKVEPPGEVRKLLGF